MNWFAVQGVLFAAMLAAPFVQHAGVPLVVRAAGVLIATGGVVLEIAGYVALGSSHSPRPTPATGAQLVRSGIYSRMRHPIYAGWCLFAIGFALTFGSLLGLAVAAAVLIYYDLRARTEERFLRERYPEYATYMRSVRRFVPGIY